VAQLIVSPEADADLEAIATFIAERDGVARATAVAERIWKTVQNLALMPRMGGSRAYLSKGRRAFPAPPWTIVYRPLPDDGGILVQRILDGRRNLTTIFKGKKRRR
jgi:plasmid stabilization system protein ParE